MAKYRKPYEPEIKEFAYTVWRESGQNMDDCSRALNGKYGYVISRATLLNWRKKYDWERRSAQADAEERLLARDSSYPSLLLALIKRKQKYDEYFDSLPVSRIDTQAVYAYSSIIKQIVNIQVQRKSEDAGSADHARIFLENLEFIVQVLKTSDPEGVKAINRNFDRIMSKYKQLETDNKHEETPPFNGTSV